MNELPWWLSLLLVLLAVVIAWFLRGWIAGRNQKNLNISYFQGLNYLLSDESDKALETFLAIASRHQHLVGLQLALANLFRKKGEVDRAIRIHQELIHRDDIDNAQRDAARFGLAEDYMKAGVLDRAENLFSSLAMQQKVNPSVFRRLVAIYEQEKDWSKAIQFALQLEGCSATRCAENIAHYYCQLAETAMHKGELKEAADRLIQAIAKNPACVRASILEGGLLEMREEWANALRCYRRVHQQDREKIPLILPDIRECYYRLDDLKGFREYLATLLETYSGISPVLYMAEEIRHKEGRDKAAEFLLSQLRRRPSVKGLDMLIDLNLAEQPGPGQEVLHMLKEITAGLLEDKLIYRCGQCGFSSKSHYWQCPSCKTWDAISFIHGVAGE